MKIILIALLNALIAHACSQVQKFSKCVDNEMLVKILYTDCPNVNSTIIQNLPCDFTCGVNKYLYYNTYGNSLACADCPKNTYNLGGGTEYTFWNTLKSFNAYCWTLSEIKWELNLNCTSWHSSSDTFLISGSSDPNTWYESDLVFYENLVQPGTLEILYRKDSPDDNPGQFFVYVNNEMSYSDFTKHEFNWKTAKISLKKGLKKIQIGFNKFSTVQTNELFIQSIIITGTKYAEFECTDCKYGTINSNNVCVECEDGSYLDEGECKECPIGTKALPGSNSIDDCKQVRKCTEQDFHFYYSDCQDNIQTKVFEWNSPLTCDNADIDLPKIQEIQCLPCAPGQSRQSGKCEYCELGSFSVSGDSDCLKCPAGKYAPKVENLSTWTQLPEGFETFCKSSSNNQCKFDWELRGEYITTSPIYLKNSKIVLKKSVKITEENSTVAFEFSIKGQNTALEFNINGVSVYKGTMNDSNAQMFDLYVGDNHLQWTCVHDSDENEECVIRKIVIYGVENGGADRCIECQDGTYSVGSVDRCQKCEYGFKENKDKTGCELCDAGMYSSTEGECDYCLDMLVVSRDNRSCVANGELVVGNNTYVLRNLSGSEGLESEICEKQDVSCYETFYGPLIGDTHNFYISVLNPYDVLMPGIPQLSNKKGYAFANINMKKIKLDGIPLSKDSENCLINSSYILVNLGTKVSSISASSNNSLTINYTSGDTCQKDSLFSSGINFICDKTQKPGYPKFTKYENCHFEFTWATIYACPICKDSEKITHTADCSDGKRKKYVFEGKYCINKGNIKYEVTEESCKQESVYKAWPFILISILLILLVILAIFIYKQIMKKKEEYQGLINGNKTAERSERESK